MEVRLKPFNFDQAVARAGLNARGEPIAKPGAAPGASFQTAMAQALRSASETQLESDALAREVQLGNPTVSIEQAMVATVKSQVAFQSVVAVRNRLVQAYTEIMNMQV
jgi:flagellar hook-basal body complex protein FliE